MSVFLYASFIAYTYLMFGLGLIQGNLSTKLSTKWKIIILSIIIIIMALIRSV